ncbi:MAG TPA: hypothetical protein VF176_09190 [Solirubrobacterales bacterium]
MKQIRKRLTYANVMSSIAVFLMIGGGAAFAALGKNTVGTKQLKPNAVTKSKLKKNAVVTAKIADQAVAAGKIANGAVGADKLGNAAVTTDKLADGAVTTGKLGNAEITTDKLADGAVTASKLGTITVETETVSVANGADGSANVDCPSGQRAISGGGAWDIFAANLSFLSSRPIRSSTDTSQMADGEVAGGWRSSGHNASGGAVSIHVWVLCAH